MRNFRICFLMAVLLLLSACVTIPQESVGLSNEVGVGLQKQHQSQIDLINLHFAINRKSLDEAMSRAIDSYFEELTSNGSSGSITLNKTQLAAVATDVMCLNNKNNAAKEKLEQARVLLIKKLNANYLILNQANSSITGLLQSVVTVENEKSEVYKKISESIDGKIDLDKVFSEIDDCIFSEIDDFILKGCEKADE